MNKICIIGQATYVQRNIEASSGSHFCHGQAISNTFSYSECVFAAVGIQYAMGMCHSHLWPVRFYNIFPHYLTYGMIFEKKKLPNKEGVFGFSLQICLKHFSF